MKLTGFRTTLFRHPRPRPMGDARTPAYASHADGCLIELNTDEGLSGVAIAREDVRVQIAELVTGPLAGQDPRAVTGLWQRMVQGCGPRGHAGVCGEAIGALDQALWDLKAKANGEPLWKTLGGARPRAYAHASGVDMALDDAALSAWYAAMARDYGFRAGKLKVGLDPAADLRRLGLMQAALRSASDTPDLMVDADECWSPKEAQCRLRELEETYDLSWVEEPVQRWDYLGAKRVSAAVRCAVCMGESLSTLGELLPHLHHHAADIVQLRIGGGGITPALQRADAAFGLELPVVLCAAPGNVHVHLASVLPYCMSVEIEDPLATGGVFSSDVRIRDGWAVAGDAPGSGLVVDRDALARAAVIAFLPGAGPPPAPGGGPDTPFGALA